MEPVYFVAVPQYDLQFGKAYAEVSTIAAVYGRPFHTYHWRPLSDVCCGIVLAYACLDDTFLLPGSGEENCDSPRANGGELGVFNNQAHATHRPPRQGKCCSICRSPYTPSAVCDSSNWIVYIAGGPHTESHI